MLYKAALVLHFCVTGLKFASFIYIDAIFDLLILLFGCLALRPKEGYGVSQITCYFYMTAFNTIWGIVRVCLWAAGVAMYSTPSYKGGNIVLGTALIGALVVYLFAAIVSYKFYKLLMAHYRAMEQNAYEQQGGGTYVQQGQGQGQSQGHQVSGGGGRSFAHTNNKQNKNMNKHRDPAPAKGSFVPFSGQGHRLG